MLKLITVLVTGIPAIIGAILAFITRKVGTATMAIASFVVMTAAFIAAINSIIQSVLGLVSAPGWILNSVGMFMPADFSAVLAAVVSARICRAAYDMAVEKIKLVNNAS